LAPNSVCSPLICPIRAMSWLQRETVVISETEKSLTELRTQLDAAVSAEDAENSQNLVMKIYELLDSDPHVTWTIVENSKVNKAVGQLQKSEIGSAGELKKQTEKLFKKLRSISDWAKGGGYMGNSKEVSVAPDDREVAQVKAKQVGSEIAAQQAWHVIPTKFSSWTSGPDGGPLRTDVPEDDPKRSAMIGDGGRARVEGRVSVVAVTSSDRYRFHGQLWLCYFSQTWEDKELVVDSGERRSPFFGRAGSDNGNVKYVHVAEPLSVGEKRNLAIRQYSTGEIIANFDDDDVYFPSYLTAMVKALKTSKSALTRLTAWNVLDFDTQFCAHFNSAAGKPSDEEARMLAGRCGFSMVYTYAAWRSIPWPHWTVGEDAAFLAAFDEVGLPITGRAEPSRGAMLALKTQHGRNMQRSVCHTSRRDVAAITAMINRYEEACRRMMKINLQEYSEAGETMLYRKLLTLNLSAEQSEPKGLYVLDAADADEERYRAWQASAEGQSPDLPWLLRRQAELRDEFLASLEGQATKHSDDGCVSAESA